MQILIKRKFSEEGDSYMVKFVYLYIYLLSVVCILVSRI